MASLLDKLLIDEPSGDEILNSVCSFGPKPEDITEQEWNLRHELPLHFLNYLRDHSDAILTASQLTNQTPNKATRPQKYKYSSPLKAVSTHEEEKKENRKRTKKKVKLFPGRKEPECLFSVKEGSGPDGDGVTTLPDSPAHVKNRMSVERDIRRLDNGRKSIGSPTFRELSPMVKSSPMITPINKIQTRRGNNANAKPTPSPQGISLMDFLSPTEQIMKKGRRSKTPKSPSKIKSSTPIASSGKVITLYTKLDLDSQDSFPGLGDTNVQKHRVKPIPVNTSQNSQNNPIFGLVPAKNPHPIFGQFVAEVDIGSVDLREMAKESAGVAPTPIKSFPSTKPPSTPTPIKQSIQRSNSRSSSCTGQLVVASVDEVTNKSTLNKLAQLYLHVLNNNLMPNVLVEIYFLLELLLVEAPLDLDSESKIDDSLSSDGLLGSVHNCVYLSSQVLGKFHKVFQFCDRPTLRLLSQNTRIQDFAGDVVLDLKLYYDNKIIVTPKVPCKSDTRLQNVSFQSETDNRSNFPSNASFHDFKKQRDNFYELIRSWQAKKEETDYSFASSLSTQTDKVLAMYNHPVNYRHFSRLFSQQLVSMCVGESSSSGDTSGDDNNAELMAVLKRSDPVKYKLLAARLVTPSKFGGPCPQPTFYGAQEFFRDFVLSCRSPQFLSHLKDTLVTEILAINNCQFDMDCNVSECDTNMSNVSLEAALTNSRTRYNSGNNSRTRYNSGNISRDSVMDLSESERSLAQFDTSLVTLRVLAKFLGFVESLPYRCEGLSETLLEGAASVRLKYIPPIDLVSMVQDASQHGRLVLTLPWVVEMVSQLDPVAWSLPYYRTLFCQLVTFYQRLSSSSSCLCSPSVAFFLSLILGWLFEMPQFPRDVMILVQMKGEKVEDGVEEGVLDLSEVVSQQLLYRCCPWVGEIKALLSQWEAGKRSSQVETTTNHRRIRPAPAPTEIRPKVDQESQQQGALEESFFQNQPNSLKRTVEFVSERLCSNVMRSVRHDLVPKQREKEVSRLKELVRAVGDDPHDGDESAYLNQARAKLELEVRQLASTSIEAVQASIFILLEESLDKNSKAVLRLLLSQDTTASVLESCSNVVMRTVREKVVQWVEQQVSHAYFTNEYTTEMERAWRLVSRVDRDEAVVVKDRVLHDPMADSIADLLISMKNNIKVLMVDDGSSLELSQAAVMEILHGLEQAVLHRADTTHMGLRGVESLSLDWALALITCCPKAISSSVLDRLVDLWAGPLPQPPQLSSLVSPRNLVLVAQSPNHLASWAMFQSLVSSVLAANLVPALVLEDQCLQLIRQEWPWEHLKQLSGCLRGVVEGWRDRQGDYGDFSEIMDWVVWFDGQEEDMGLDGFHPQ